MNITKKIDIMKIRGEETTKEEDILITEYPLTIFVNDEEVVTLLCTPKSVKELAIGFLFSEGILKDMSNILNISFNSEDGLIYIDIENRSELIEKLRGKRTITSGCGKGTIFYNVLDSFKSKKIRKQIDIKTYQIKKLMKKFNHKSELFLQTGGVHSVALCDKNEILFFEEDIGRHNALDKILGRSMMENINLNNKIVLTSGRISSEILIKVAKGGISTIISRSAPTSLSVEMANKLNIKLIGFARGEKLNIYSNFDIFNLK